MISENITVKDIDPVTWRNLSGIINGFLHSEKSAVYLFEDGICKKGYSYCDKSTISSLPGKFTLKELQAFSSENTGFSRLIAVDYTLYKQLTMRLYEKPFRDLSLSEYLNFKNRIILHEEIGKSILIYPDLPPDEFPMNYQNVLDFIKEYDNCSMILGIFDGNMQFINLVITIEKGSVTDLRTFDYFSSTGNIKIQYSKNCLNELEETVSADFAPVKISLFAQKEHFLLLIKSKTKEIEAEMQDHKQVSFGRYNHHSDWVNLSEVPLFCFTGLKHFLLPFPFPPA